MFDVDDVVVYTTYGICRITEIIERVFNGQTGKYYILVPLSESRTKLTIPVDNPITKQRLHCLLSADEINTIIREIPFLEPTWIDNDNLRKKEFGDIIKNGNRKEILMILKSIRVHANNLKNKGRKLHACDEQCMKDGEKLIFDEFSYVLKTEKALISQQIWLELDK